MTQSKHDRIGWLPILFLWLIVSAALIWISRDNIATLGGWDPDDQLRMVQLRDFLAGQGWFDTTQHRINPPDGAPMHWSRLIELPLALLVWIFAPLFGQHGAEAIAGTIVPLLLLGWIAIMIAQITTRVASREAGVVAAMIALSASAMVMQLRPMRIDHHGWQLAMAVLALSTMFWPNARRAGAVMGLALAVWLHISLEGAPMTAAFFLLLGWRWARDKAQAIRLFWTIASFASFTLLLFVATQAQPFAAQIYCDTVSPPQLWAALFAAAVMLPAIVLLPPDWRLRLVTGLFAGGGALAILLWQAPECMSGAFGSLDPLVRDYWYANISEGLPIWHSKWQASTVLIAGPVCGALSWLLLMRNSNGADRKKLQTLGFFLFYAIILTFAIIRTVSVAAAYAAPVTAILVSELFKKYRRSQVPVRRVGLVAAMLALMLPGALVVSLTGLLPKAQQTGTTGAAGKDADASCESVGSVAALASLGKARFLAPFDMGPTILLATPGEVIATSHHRNRQGMHDQIEIFISAPNKARNLIDKRAITHVALCMDEAELRIYARNNPDSLAALIRKGGAPAWLEPLPDMGDGIKVWRVR